MSTEVCTILLCPSAAYQARLLSGDVCGGQPPQYTRWPGHPWRPGALPEHPNGQTVRALVLAFAGTEVYSGTDRLRRLITEMKSIGFFLPPGMAPELQDACHLALYAEWMGMGTVRFLDSADKEVSS